jgi:hypothetical protein
VTSFVNGGSDYRSLSRRACQLPKGGMTGAGRRSGG